MWAHFWSHLILRHDTGDLPLGKNRHMHSKFQMSHKNWLITFFFNLMQLLIQSLFSHWTPHQHESSLMIVPDCILPSLNGLFHLLAAHVQMWFRKTRKSNQLARSWGQWSRLTPVKQRRGEGGRKTSFIKTTRLFHSDMSVGNSEQTDPDTLASGMRTAVSVSWGSRWGEVESDMSNTFYHKDVSIKSASALSITVTALRWFTC